MIFGSNNDEKETQQMNDIHCLLEVDKGYETPKYSFFSQHAYWNYNKDYNHLSKSWFC